MVRVLSSLFSSIVILAFVLSCDRDVDVPELDPVVDEPSGGLVVMETTEQDAPEVEVKNELSPSSPECEKVLSELDEQATQYGLGAAELISAEDALEIGRCFRVAGKIMEARGWLEAAASDAKTKVRASRALRELAAE